MFKKRGFDKKATSTIKIYIFIIQLILVGISFAALLKFFGVANNTLLEKNYFSIDLSLLVNTIYAAPGNVDYTYGGNISKYEFLVKFSKYQTAVYEEGETPETAVFYPFMEDKAMKFEYKDLAFEKGEKLRFSKEAATIKVDKQLQAQTQLMECPEIATKEAIKGKRIVIDPSHLTEPEDLGDSFEDINEAQKMLEIAEKIETSSSKFEVGLTRGDSEKSIEERKEIIKEKNPAIVISIRTNNEKEPTLKVIASSKADETLQKKSKKLGCLILNKFAENKDLKDFKIHTVNPISKEPSEDEILYNDRISIIFEIGSIQNKDFFEKTDLIAASIVSGIEDYYEK